MRNIATRKFTALAISAAALSAGGTLAATALANSSSTTATSSRPAIAASAASSQAPTERVVEIVGVMSKRFTDIPPVTTKGIKAPDGTQTWVVVGAEHTCFGADNSDGTGYTCADNAAVAATGLSLIEKHADGSARGVFLVPDGVARITVNGKAYSPSSNLVVASLPKDAAVQAVHSDGDTVSLVR